MELKTRLSELRKPRSSIEGNGLVAGSSDAVSEPSEEMRHEMEAIAQSIESQLMPIEQTIDDYYQTVAGDVPERQLI